MCFAMPQIPWRRSDQLCNLVAMLEFRAIDLNNRARAFHQRFGRGFDDARLAGTGGTKEQKPATFCLPPSLPLSTPPYHRATCMPHRTRDGLEPYFKGFDGLTSTRLIKVLAGVFNSISTISATSSGAIFHCPPPEPELNSVATLPGKM